MSSTTSAATFRFSPDLGAWIVHNLDSGCAPSALVQAMIEREVLPSAAQAIVDAFVEARAAGLPVPVDSVSLPGPAAEYVSEAPRIARGPLIQTSDQAARVLMRVERPLIVALADVLTQDECQQLIELARPRLKPSTVVDPATGQDVVAPYRSSLGMFFRLRENPLIERLDRRVAEVMGLPLEHGEGFQVLCYPEGAYSAPHFDFIVPSNPANQASIARSGQRVSTLVAYLNDVEAGGETGFPEAGVTVSARAGHAVYFEYANSLGQVDQRSVHAGSPVLRGEKWVLTKWMRQRRFVSASAASSDGMIRRQEPA
jgi:prolyl 4-hydroxylase